MTDKKRFVNQREQLYSISRPTPDDPTLVVCPKCRKMAKVFLTDTQPEMSFSARAVCSNCGYFKEKTTNEKTFLSHDDPSDGYFEYDLWMKTACCGHTLWAYNRRHLDFLESFVSAELRENPKDDLGYSNASLASRLPTWIQSRKNRKQILEGLGKLRKLGNL